MTVCIVLSQLSPVGTALGTFAAEDKDGQQLQYKLTPASVRLEFRYILVLFDFHSPIQRKLLAQETDLKEFVLFDFCRVLLNCRHL